MHALLVTHLLGHGCRGKQITKLDNIILVFEPFLKYQVGRPYEAWRALNGRLFAAAGRAIYKAMDWWHTTKAWAPDAAVHW